MIREFKKSDGYLLKKYIVKYPSLGLILQGNYMLKKHIPQLPSFYIAEDKLSQAIFWINSSNECVILSKIPNEEEFFLFIKMFGVDIISSPFQINIGKNIAPIHEMKAFSQVLNTDALLPKRLKITTDVKIKDIIHLQAEIFDTQDKKDGFYSFICSMKNYGYLKTYAIYDTENKKLISVICVQTLKSVSPLYIFAVYTRVNDRNKGYIKQLLKIIYDDFKNKEIYLLFTPALIKFYEKHGFKQQQIYNKRKM